MDSSCHIMLFGPLRVEQAGRTLTRFRTQKTAALLAYLAYRLSQAHTREELAERFWPESDPQAGRASLNVAISSLRHQLESNGVEAGSILLADRFTVQLNPQNVRTDVALFVQRLQEARRAASPLERAHRLADAVACYTAPLLPDLYDDWILPEQQHLQDTCLNALRELSRYWREQQQSERALEYARRALEIDPLREETCGDLIALLGEQGQGEEAWRCYQEFARRLQQEWAETPSPELHRQAQRWRQRSAADRAPETILSASQSAVGFAADLPSVGTLTVLLSEWRNELEASECESVRQAARLWGGLLARQDGTVLTWIFPRVSDAAAALIAIHTKYPERVRRAALDLVEVRLKEGAPSQSVFQLATRLLLSAPDEQTLCSEPTAHLLQRDLPPDWRLHDSGSFLLPEIETPQRVFALLRAETSQPPPPPRATPLRVGALPQPLTRFFGRQTEAAQVQRLLDPLSQDSPTRLVTLTGIGGQGKTRLAIECGNALSAAYRGAVWFVPLAEIEEAARLPEAIRDTLHLPAQSGQSAADQVFTALGEQASLLILDNFEQIVEEGARFVSDLLARTPRLRLLVTSRHTLRIAGEQEVQVAPLTIPAAGVAPNTPSECESVALFLDRAQRVRPDFALTPHQAPIIAEICRRLEGIPMALELAAARAQLLTPAQMLAQMKDRFQFLVSRQRDSVTRHRTLYAALDWSFRLLTPPQQRLLADLSIFRGGCTPESALAVCTEAVEKLEISMDWEMAESLLQLRECSLLTLQPAESGARFGMLESVRMFAKEHLAVEGEAGCHARHAAYFTRLAETGDVALKGAEQKWWLQRLNAEHENLRAALAWTCSAADQTELALRLAGALALFWDAGGHVQEGTQSLRTALALAGEASVTVRIRALQTLGSLLSEQGDFAGAQDCFEQSLALHDQLDAPASRAHTLNNLAGIAYRRGRLKEARTCWFALIPLREATGDAWGASVTWNNLGIVACDQGDYVDARRYHEQSLAIKRSLEDLRGISISLNNLGVAASRQADYAQARRYLEESRQIKRALGDERSEAYTLHTLAQIARNEGDFAAARPLLEEALALLRKHNDRRGIAYTVAALGETDQFQQHFTEAAALYGESLILAQEMQEEELITRLWMRQAQVVGALGDLPEMRRLATMALQRFQAVDDKNGLTETLEILAQNTVSLGDPHRATRLLAAAHTLRTQHHLPLHRCDRAQVEPLQAELKAVLGDAYELEWTHGSILSLEQAVELALKPIR